MRRPAVVKIFKQLQQSRVRLVLRDVRWELGSHRDRMQANVQMPLYTYTRCLHTRWTHRSLVRTVDEKFGRFSSALDSQQRAARQRRRRCWRSPTSLTWATTENKRTTATTTSTTARSFRVGIFVCLYFVHWLWPVVQGAQSFALAVFPCERLREMAAPGAQHRPPPSQVHAKCVQTNMNI